MCFIRSWNLTISVIFKNVTNKPYYMAFSAHRAHITNSYYLTWSLLQTSDEDILI